MTVNKASNMNFLSVIGSSYFRFTKARYFAGLFCGGLGPDLSET